MKLRVNEVTPRKSAAVTVPVLQFGITQRQVRAHAADIHIAADIGQDDSVFFHSCQDNAVMHRELADIKAGFQPQLCTKWQGILPAGAI